MRGGFDVFTDPPVYFRRHCRAPMPISCERLNRAERRVVRFCWIPDRVCPGTLSVVPGVGVEPTRPVRASGF